MIAPFVDQQEFAALIGPVVLADVRWYLDDRSGRDEYEAGHLPGAIFVDLDTDLAGPPSITAGRHPLPSPEAFAATRSRLGMSPGTAVVAYDDAGGVIAARLVWMLRAIGQPAALLDGGLLAWGGPLSTEPVEPDATTGLEPVPLPDEFIAGLDDVAGAATGELVLVDARPADRFAGTAPDIDPRPGHIPGARSLPCRENVEPDGRLITGEELRARLAGVAVTAETVAAGRVVSSCGSGVTACHNLLAIEHAGLGRARLYPGSWSQYSATDRPVATGFAG